MRTRDIDEAIDVVGKVYCSHKVEVVGSVRDIDARLEVTHTTTQPLVHLAYGAPVDIKAANFPGLFLAHHCTHGSARATQHRHSAEWRRGQTVPLSADLATQLSFDRDHAQNTVRLDIEKLEALCARWLGRPLEQPLHAIRAALPHLRSGGGGAIVAISAIAAQMCQPRNVQGAAAKAGLEAIVRVVAREEGKRGIRANAVAIGLTDTDMGRAALAQWGPQTSERVVCAIPLRRIGTPEEVARVVCFLAGPDAGYITGKVLQVDGGQIIAA